VPLIDSNPVECASGPHDGQAELVRNWLKEYEKRPMRSVKEWGAMLVVAKLREPHGRRAISIMPAGAQCVTTSRAAAIESRRSGDADTD
jgi:hypothetical protein